MARTTVANSPIRVRAVWWVLIVIVGILTVTGIVFAIDSAADPAHSEPSHTIATAEVDGRDIAVVVYRGDTFGRIDIFRMDSIGYSTQAEAFDLGTGERVWDTMLFAEFGGTEADVLGMGEKYVYVTSAKGLVILDAATGEIITQEGEIAGLGEDYIAAVDTYAWDAETHAVVLLDERGTVLTIPADQLEAVAAPSEVADRWINELGVDSAPGTLFTPGEWDHTTHWVPLDDGTRVEPVWAVDGWNVDVLLESQAPAETGRAAGLASGFAITQTYQPVTGEATYLIQVGDPATGRLIDIVETDDNIWALSVSEAGHVVMLSNNDTYQGLLLVASADGIRSSIIGERGFLGW